MYIAKKLYKIEIEQKFTKFMTKYEIKNVFITEYATETPFIIALVTGSIALTVFTNG